MQTMSCDSWPWGAKGGKPPFPVTLAMPVAIKLVRTAQEKTLLRIEPPNIEN